ncbi:MAG: RNA 2',3'-cyclic phosphodiesterase [Alphaproteobacteria bacterium]
MIRLFAAIEMPEATRRSLSDLCHGIPGARWTPDENLHLTLRFIGEVDEDIADDIDHALAGVRAPGFDLTIDRVDAFGSKEKARSIWAGIAPNPALDLLQGRIESALVRAGLPPEGRKFIPHITLARLKSAQLAAVAGYLAEHGLIAIEPVEVRAITLFSSVLSHNGAIHTAEVVYPLDIDKLERNPI